MITSDKLVELMEKFINLRSTRMNDLYISERGMSELILIEFAEFLGKNLEESSSITSTKENLP